MKDIHKEGSFFVDIMKLAGGTALAQALGILAAPIITRLFSPEAYGLAALFTSIAGLIVTIICLRYEIAIMLPKKDEEAANILGICIFFILLISFLSIPFTIFGSHSIQVLLNEPDIGPYLWLLTPFLFLNGFFYCFSNWFARKKWFGLLSLVRTANSFVTTGLILCAGIAGYATGGSMIVSSVIGFGVTAIALGAKIFRDDGAMLRRSITKKGLISGLDRYKKFPLIDTWGALVQGATWQAPIVVLSWDFSPSVVGYYALAVNVLGVPMSIIGEAIGKVFFQRSAKAKSDHKLELNSIIEITLTELTIIGFFPLLILSLIGKEIFTVFFGAAWAEAGVFTQILALWIFFVFVTEPLNSLFSVYEIQGSYLVFKLILLVTRIGSIVLGGALGSVYISIILFSITGALNYMGVTLWLLHKSDIPIQKVLKRFFRTISYGIPTIIAIFLAKWIFSLSPEIIILIGGLTALPYYAFALRGDKMIRELTYSIVRSIFELIGRQYDDVN